MSVLTDDCSGYCKVYLLMNKSEAFAKFKEYKAAAETQTGQVLKRLRTDNGKELLSNEFKEYLKGCGVVHELTIPYTPEQNAVAERRMRTLLEAVRSMLFFAHLDKDFWGFALIAANYISNRLPTSIHDSTQYERMFDSFVQGTAVASDTDFVII